VVSVPEAVLYEGAIMATQRPSLRQIRHTASFLFVLGLLMSVPAMQAATYYVDQSGGSDNNSGTSPSSAWKSAPGMNAYSGNKSLQPGDTVYFDRDDVWLVTGEEGLYLVGGVTYIGDSWEADGGNTGTRATLRANANLEAGVVRFRDHATLPTTLKGFNVDANNKVTSGIDINHRYWQLMSGALKKVENVEVQHTNSRQANGEYKYGIIISNFGGNAGFTQNVEITNCVVHDISRDGIALYPGDGVQDSIRFVTVRGCEVYNTGQDPGYAEGHGFTVKGWVRDSTIEYNYVHDVASSAVFFSGPENDGDQRSAENVVIRHNILTSQDNNGIIRLYSKGSKDVKIYGNLIFDNSITGGLSLAGAESGTLDLLVYNNVFYNTYVDFGGHSLNVHTLEFKNNIVQYSSSQLRNSGSITSQSNNILTSSNPGFSNPNSKPSGFVGTHGVDLRPNTDGFALTSGSSALNTGTALGSAYNSSINSVSRPQGSGWDIGAYEMGGSSTGVSAPTNLSAVVQ
jgi:hypothetical protein